MYICILYRIDVRSIFAYYLWHDFAGQPSVLREWNDQGTWSQGANYYGASHQKGHSSRQSLDRWRHHTHSKFHPIPSQAINLAWLCGSIIDSPAFSEPQDYLSITAIMLQVGVLLLGTFLAAVSWLPISWNMIACWTNEYQQCISKIEM